MKKLFLLSILVNGIVTLGLCQNFEKIYAEAQDSIDNYNYSAGFFLANQCIKTKPKRDSAYTLRAYCASIFGNDQQAYEDGLKTLELNPNNSYAYYICGMANSKIPISQEEQDSILSIYRLYGKDSMNSIFTNYKIPNGTHNQSYFNYGKSFTLFKKAIELDSTYAEAIYMIGYYYNELSITDSSLKYFSRAIALDSIQSKYYIARGLVYKDLYRTKESLADLNKAITADPSSGLAYSNRAYLKREQLDDPKGACEDLKKAQLLGSYDYQYYAKCK